MNVLIAYSSKTGNTKAVAEAVAGALGEGAVLAPVSVAPAYEPFDLVVVGFWIDKGGPDAEALRYIRQLKGKRVAFFFTLGADPDSGHAKDCLERSKACFGGNELTGHFFCQGRISEAMMKWMKRIPKWMPHGPTPERLARWERASTHPDADDLARAAWYFKELTTLHR